MTRPSTISTIEIAAALAIGTVGVLMVGIQPILLGALVDAHSVSLEGVGLVAMAEIIAIGCGVLIGDSFIAPAALRRAVLIAGTLLIAADLLTMSGKGDIELIVLRACAGLAEGILVWGATAVIIRTANPGRVGGIFFVGQTLAQALFGALEANAAIPAGGWAMGFDALAATALLALLLAFALPRSLRPIIDAGSGAFRWSFGHVSVLFTVFLQLAALGAFWAYIEPLGQAAGLDASMAHTLVSTVLALQVIGGCASLALLKRLPAAVALLLCSLGLILIMALELGLGAGSTRAFFALGIPLGFCWLFMLPFQIEHAFGADRSGRIAALVPAAQLLGSAFGPLTASLAVAGEDASRIPYLSAGYAVLALVLLAVPRRGTAGVMGSARFD